MGFGLGVKKAPAKMEDNLEALLDLYSQSYYNDSISLISDDLFDELKNKYKEVTGKEYNKVGSYIDSRLKKEVHKHPMLSLEKVNTVDVLHKWILNKDDIIFALDWKLDGVSLSLVYEYGYLVKAITRGNGTEGENVTHNVKYISNIPMYVENLKGDKFIEVRGEVVISKDNFAKLQADNPEFINARNLASGSLRLKEYHKVKTRKLDFIAYYIYDSDGLKYDIDSSSQKLSQMGFDSSCRLVELYKKDITFLSLDDLITSLYETKSDYKYQTDGLVLKVCNKTYIKELGSTDHHPKSMVAFKFQAERKGSTLLDIEWQTSATGRINPVGIIKPIELSGVTVERVSLHNLDIIEKLELKLNDGVTICRSNEVIPYLLDRCETEKSTDIKYPDKCPSCGAKTIRDGIFLYCSAENNCLAVIQNKIIKMAEIMEIKGIGDAVAAKAACMLNIGEPYTKVIKFSLSEWQQATNSSVLGKKVYENIQDALKTFDDSKALACLFLEGVGLSMAKKITTHFKYNKLLLKSYSDFIKIPQVGDAIARKLSNFDIFTKIVYDSLKPFVVEEERPIIKSQRLNAKTYCITGSFVDLPRSKIEKMIIENGGQLAGVSKKLDYLLCGDKAGSKLEKARALGVEIITYYDFLRQLDE